MNTKLPRIILYIISLLLILHGFDARSDDELGTKKLPTKNIIFMISKCLTISVMFIIMRIFYLNLQHLA